MKIRIDDYGSVYLSEETIRSILGLEDTHIYFTFMQKIYKIYHGIVNVTDDTEIDTETFIDMLMLKESIIPLYNGAEYYTLVGAGIILKRTFYFDDFDSIKDLQSGMFFYAEEEARNYMDYKKEDMENLEDK